MSADLHAAILAAIEDLEQTARAGSPWKTHGEDTGTIEYGDFGWYVVGGPAGEFEDSEQGKADAALYRATGDPASVLRRCAAARRVLERHRLEDYRLEDDVQPYCAACGHEPTDEAPHCADIRDLADSLGIQTSDEGS